MSTEATVSRIMARLSRPSANSWCQFRVTLSRMAQNTSDQTIRLATISIGEAMPIVRKYSGSRPHKP